MPHKSVTKWGIYSLKKYLGVDQLLYDTSTECSRRLMGCVGQNIYRSRFFPRVNQLLVSQH